MSFDFFRLEPILFTRQNNESIPAKWNLSDFLWRALIATEPFQHHYIPQGEPLPEQIQTRDNYLEDKIAQRNRVNDMVGDELEKFRINYETDCKKSLERINSERAEKAAHFRKYINLVDNWPAPPELENCKAELINKLKDGLQMYDPPYDWTHIEARAKLDIQTWKTDFISSLNREIEFATINHRQRKAETNKLNELLTALRQSVGLPSTKGESRHCYCSGSDLLNYGCKCGVK